MAKHTVIKVHKKRFTMQKQRPASTQYRGELFYDMPAPLMKYRRYDRKRMEMFDVQSDAELRDEERRYWKIHGKKSMQPR